MKMLWLVVGLLLCGCKASDYRTRNALTADEARAIAAATFPTLTTDERVNAILHRLTQVANDGRCQCVIRAYPGDDVDAVTEMLLTRGFTVTVVTDGCYSDYHINW